MVGRKVGLMRFHKISPCPKCGGKQFKLIYESLEADDE